MSYTVNTDSFKQNMKKAERDIQDNLKLINRKSTVSAMEKSAIYVPPGMGKRSIHSKLYKRGIRYLPNEVKNKKNKTLNEDLEKLKSGYLFKVQHIKNKKKSYRYYTTLRNAKKHSRIMNRGLWRFMFGANISILGLPLPRIFQTLLNKSKNLANLKKLNSITEKNNSDSSMQIKYQNKANGNDSFRGKVKQIAQIQYKKTLKRLFRNYEKNKIKV